MTTPRAGRFQSDMGAGWGAGGAARPLIAVFPSDLIHINQMVRAQ
ncbi:hypothetical protein [uncultured Sulfitobacter sp.]|nr:hypothetical protein [uncultured Sulfitobacter sp.]